MYNNKTPDSEIRLTPAMLAYETDNLFPPGEKEKKSAAYKSALAALLQVAERGFSVHLFGVRTFYSPHRNRHYLSLGGWYNEAAEVFWRGIRVKTFDTLKRDPQTFRHRDKTALLDWPVFVPPEVVLGWSEKEWIKFFHYYLYWAAQETERNLGRKSLALEEKEKKLDQQVELLRGVRCSLEEYAK